MSRQLIAILFLTSLILGLAALNFCSPHYLSDDGNGFLKAFVNQELLSFLGVIVTITLASAANLHLEFNRLQVLTKEGFREARAAVKAYAVLLLILFSAAFLIVVLKPILGVGAHRSAAFNSIAIIIVTLNIMSLADLTLAIFRIEPTPAP